MAKRLWSFSYGPRGHRVLVYLDEGEPSILLQYRKDGKRKTLSLEHRNRKRAEAEAKQFVEARLEALRKKEPEATPTDLSSIRSPNLTVGELIDLFLASQYLKSLTEKQQRNNRTRLTNWRHYLGEDRLVQSLDEEDVLGFIRARKSGRFSRDQKSFTMPQAQGQQSHYNDFSALRAAIRWAMRSKDSRGKPLLPINPLQGVTVEQEKSPRQVEIDHRTYLTIRRAARKRPLWRVFLITIEMTGRRENSIRLLKWPDIDFEHEMIRFRKEVEAGETTLKADKEGYEDFIPVPPRLVGVLKRWRERNPDTEWVFERRNARGAATGRPYSLSHVDRIPETLFKDAGLSKPRGLGWHSFRRKFISETEGREEEVMVLTGHRSLAAFHRYRRPQVERMKQLVRKQRSRI